MKIGCAWKECPCGSGLEQRDLVDARGIFAGFVCDQCERQARAKVRPEVLDDPDYGTDEPVDDDDGDGWDGQYCDGEDVL